MHPQPSPRSVPDSSALRPRYILIGGFLGAGKTTAMGLLARHLERRGQRVGLITNDQGRNLVDTALLRSQGFATEEIPGGCFCCRFDSLVDASRRLTESIRPDVFLAEPVGSCTDLAATVTYPLRRLYGDRFVVAPVSVLLDPIRAERVFGLQPGAVFSRKVLYIYRKQIEEADLVVIAKADLLDPSRLEALRAAIAQAFPDKEILVVSARDGTGLDRWFARTTGDEQSARSAMNVDYETYAEGEALLGWLNATARISARTAVDANRLLTTLAGQLQSRLLSAGAEVAHLKMTFAPDGLPAGGLAAVSLVRTDFIPELSLRLEEPVDSGLLILNLRAEADPEVLGAVVRESLTQLEDDSPGLRATLDHLEHFRPGKPTPTHRIAVLAP